MSALGAILERFDAPDLDGGEDAHTQQLKAAAYAAGYAAGEGAATAQTTADVALLDRLTAALDKALADMSGQLNAQLADALSTVIQKTLPAISEKGFAIEFASTVMEQVNFSTGVQLSVRAAPDRVQTIEAAFADFANRKAITIEPDQSLSDDAVVAQWGDAGFEFKPQAAIDRIVDALDQCVSQPANGKSP